MIDNWLDHLEVSWIYNRISIYGSGEKSGWNSFALRCDKTTGKLVNRKWRKVKDQKVTFLWWNTFMTLTIKDNHITYDPSVTWHIYRPYHQPLNTNALFRKVHLGSCLKHIRFNSIHSIDMVEFEWKKILTRMKSDSTSNSLSHFTRSTNGSLFELCKSFV